VTRTFTDQYGTELSVSGETARAGCARVGISERCGIHVKAEDFPALATALYEAAGLPAPVILERPEVDPEGAKGVNVFRVLLDDDLSVCVGYGSHKAASVAPSVARHLASAIAAYADAAEAAHGIDPAEVEELAGLMDAEMDHRGRGQSGLYPACARIALQWFRDRQQRGDGHDG